MKKITERVWQLAQPVTEKHGCILWDIEYVKEAGQWFLRVYIDREEGVSIDHCEAISRELDGILDEQDLIQDSYTFEVSSAGVERPLRRPSDFERFMGSPVEVKLYSPMDGKKTYTGTLSGYESGDVEITADGKSLRFTKKELANVRLTLDQLTRKE